MNKLQHLQYLNFRKPSRYADNITAIQARPSLDLNFARNKSLMDNVTGNNLITFTRASSGTFTDSAGVLQTAAADVPRFDHNPTTGESLGLLVEEQRTNSIVNSNSMTAVVTGSPGTLPTGWSAQGNAGGWTREVVGSGSIGALNYVDVRFFGTPTGTQFGMTFQGQGVVAASNGQSWAASVYHQLVGGSMSNIGFFPAANLWNSSVAFIGSISVPVGAGPSSTFQRYTGGGTINNAAAAFISWGITFTCTVGNTYDFTIRFAGPQLEQGVFATSPIPTTTAAVTRSADVASITSSAFSGWYRQDEGTVFTEAVGVNNIASATRRFVEIFDGTSNERIVIGYSATNNTRLLVVDGGAIQSDRTVTGVNAGTSVKMSAAYKIDDFRQASNGTLSTAGTSGTLPIVNQMLIGDAGGSGTTLNGHIRRITYWPTRISNANLQRITQ